MGTVLAVISYTSPHLTSTKSNNGEIVIAFDSNGLRGEMNLHGSAGRWRWVVPPDLFDTQAQALLLLVVCCCFVLCLGFFCHKNGH